MEYPALLQRREWLRQGAVDRNTAERVSFAEPQSAIARLAKPRRVCKHGLEHRLQFTRRAADHAEHFGGCRLLFQRLAEFAATRLYFVERTYAFDGDDGLVGEGFEKLDLPVGKASGLGSRHGDRPDRTTVLDHRDRHDAAVFDELCSVAMLIVAVRVDIRDFLDGAAED